MKKNYFMKPPVKRLLGTKWGLATMVLVMVIINGTVSLFLPNDLSRFSELRVTGIVMRIDSNIMPMMNQLQSVGFIALKQELADVWQVTLGTNLMLNAIVLPLAAAARYLKSAFPGKKDAV